MIGRKTLPEPPDDYIPPTGSEARLYLNGREVGTITVLGKGSTWTHGQFTPSDLFAEFAGLFGEWSLLMHDDEDRPLHPEAQDALADVERRMDALHAKIHFPDRDLWRDARQLNIDGTTVEWKEF